MRQYFKMKKPEQKIIKHLSGAQFIVTNKRIGKTIHLEVDSDTLNNDSVYNSPRSYVTRALTQLFKNDINPN